MEKVDQKFKLKKMKYAIVNIKILFVSMILLKDIILKNISVAGGIFDSLLMISKDLLIITGKNIISIININSYNLIKTINVDNSGSINVACMLNKDMILTGDQNKRIIQWKFENDNLKLISKKENAHDNEINTIEKLGNGLILSGSGDKSVKIW